MSFKAGVAMGLSALLLTSWGAEAWARTGPVALSGQTRAVRVKWGEIGYRSMGQGRALVLVTGTPASIDLWAPSFLDLLARHHRVFVFDNEGVGLTTLRPGRLTITRMADDTADFIAALHLKRPDVLGWSMGGWIAQALAVRHPSALRRMILCAALAGDGTAKFPYPVQSYRPFDTLFPPDQNAARLEFIQDIHRYRGFYETPPSVRALQARAIAGWVTGEEPAGYRLGEIQAPTLIGDGSQDPYDPISNSYHLRDAIPHAQLHIYADASHGFWFQDRFDWVRRIDRFLASPGT
jgi:pimeloyl-ACP methyl ester carboxylesterase